jgi:hypothetical protein
MLASAYVSHITTAKLEEAPEDAAQSASAEDEIFGF